MSQNIIQQLEDKIDRLVDRLDRLNYENKTLKEERFQWEQERTKLIEKNQYARERVEAMITHLKSIETES